jgi:hypothetical protein
MREFDKIVKKAQAEIDPRSAKTPMLSAAKYRLPVSYAILVDGYNQETWPTTFLHSPKTGDFVESNSGKKLRISEITHRHGGITITLARDLGGSTAMEGAGSNVNPF